VSSRARWRGPVAVGRCPGLRTGDAEAWNGDLDAVLADAAYIRLPSTWPV